MITAAAARQTAAMNTAPRLDEPPPPVAVPQRADYGIDAPPVVRNLLLVGAGAKSNQPLVFQRGGTPYRGFLEGRTQGEAYCLILHLSNLELRAPAEKA